jgi:hypothetical protein
MGLFEIIIGAAILAVVAFQVYLTVRVFRSRMYERKQKVWQAQLIWLLPVIGAGLVFTILQEDDQAERDAKRAEREALSESDKPLR